MPRPIVALLVTLPLLPAHGAADSIALSDCRIGAGPAYSTIQAKCGTFERLENPDDPESPTIELRVAVVPALDLDPAPDPFVPLAGGPGQGAIQFYSAYRGAFEHVRRDRDILLVDQRGTGESSRMDCPIDDDLAIGRYSTELTLEQSEACLLQLPHDPRFFTTSIAVRDLEAVRAALGYPQLNLYGISYGTRVAQHYARVFPERARSVVLDGVVPPQVPLGPEIAIEAQRALDRIFERCESDAPCAERFPQLRKDFLELTERLDQGDVIVELQDPATGRLESVDFGRADLSAAIRLLAYHPNTIALLPLVISDAADGNFIPIAAQFQMTIAELADSLALGMHNSVMCSEDVPFFDSGEIDVVALEASYMGPLQLEAFEAICSIWPRGPVDEMFREPLSGDVPVLLLSGDADPITPPRYAELAAVNLDPGRSEHLVGRNQGHGQAPVGCTPRLIADFIDDLDTENLDVECMDRSFAMPFFLDYAGPQP